MRQLILLPARKIRTNKTKHKTDKTMKKYIIIAAAAIVASVGITYAANSLRSVEDHSKCENYRCSSCKGSGFHGNVACYTCKGTGKQGSY